MNCTPRGGRGATGPGASPELGIVAGRMPEYVWQQIITSMHTACRSALVGLSLVAATSLSAQIRFGGRVGTNFLIASQKIQPDPKNAPTTPKGLGLVFGGYAEIPFSDLVGIRPDLSFSFRKAKNELSISNTLTNNTDVTNGAGAYTGSQDFKGVNDQRLSYFQINLPLMLKPSDGLRIMVGPSVNFLMGGKLNTDETTSFKGTVTGQNQQGQQVTQSIDQQDFQTTKKTGSAAIKDFKKAEVDVVAGLGYTLPVGFDMDLRFYRSLTTTYDHSEGTARTRYWTNLVEFSVGWTFGGK